MSKPLILFETVAMAVILSAQGATVASPRVADLISRMTLEEKVGQLVQRLSGPLEGKAAADSSGLTPTERQLVEIRRGEIGSLQGCCGVKNFNAFQQAAMESRLRIPLMVGHDMVHGVGTQLPIPLGLSATWDTNIWRRTGTLIARETPLRGCNWTYAPMVDIARDARWGRIAESPGQDPYLATLYAAEMVRGIQSEPPAGGMRVAACLKHFVGYGASVGGRDYDEVEMSDRTLDEVYLPPFASGIAAGALTVMPAFHTFNGVPCTVNRFLLTDVLRGRLGFTGFCISDHGALHECGPEGHDVWTTFEEGAAAGLSAGLDQEMTRRGAFTYPRGLANAVRTGLVSEAQLDACVRNVLRVKEALGLFDRPFIDAAACEAAVDVERHLSLAREAAAKSAVLLKNAGVLPLRPGAKLVVMGDLAANEDEMRGCWSPFFINRRNATLVDGLKADGFPVEYARCYTMTGAVDVAAIEAAAQKGDVIVAAFGEYYWQNGENHSYSDISLRGRQAEAAAAIKRTGKPFVAVVFSGRPLVLNELAEAADAIVEAWNPGSCGGWGIADVLSGAVEPYGRLTADFPRASGQCPLYYNRKPTGRPNDGGRHFWRTHYEDVAFDPLYPFGFGLSYTTFAFANPSVTKEGERVVFSADVTNTGKRRGSEVVQLYLRPRGSSLSAPVRELKGYVRLDLAPGETRRAEIAVPHALLKGKRCDYALAPDSRADGVGGTFELSDGLAVSDSSGTRTITQKERK